MHLCRSDMPICFESLNTRTQLYAYIHTYIHTHIHEYTHTYIHLCRSDMPICFESLNTRTTVSDGGYTCVPLIGMHENKPLPMGVVCLQVCMHACVYVRMYVCTRVLLIRCMKISPYLWALCVCRYACMYVCMYVCVFVCHYLCL